MYGYELSKKAREMTNGDLDITEGALYPTLHKMEAQGLVVTEVENIGKRPRKYYKLTESGGVEARNRIEELNEYVRNLQYFLNPNFSQG
jgi:DNA-binding PadR family transcriptional regulator